MIKTPIKPQKDSIIWRYLGVDKFIDLLLTGTIKFTLVSIAYDKNEINWILKTLIDSKEDPKGAAYHIRNLRNSTYISCWTMKENESRSLWATYLDSTKQGVAIKTNVGKFIESIEWKQFGFDYRIVDYRNKFNPEELQNNITIINTKSTAYIEESEVRFYISGFNTIDTSLDDPKKYHEDLLKYINGSENREKVISLKINLDSLVSELMISPYSSKWQKDNLIKLIEDYKPKLLNRVTNSIVNE